MQIEHYLVLEKIEIVVCDDNRFFVVDRAREQLWNVLDPSEVLPLAQRQVGRLPHGELEVLERYQTDDEQGESALRKSPRAGACEI